MSEPQPGVRRLCVAAATGPACLLTTACRSGDVARLCVMADLPGGTEMAFAPPGVDELAVVTRLITVLRRLAASRPGVPRPALLAFHVGITRIEGDGLGGEAAIRTRTLLLHPAVRGAAGAGAADGSGQLAVIISDWLYADLRAEGLPGEDWMRIPAAGGWLRHCETARSISRNDPAYRASPAR